MLVVVWVVGGREVIAQPAPFPQPPASGSEGVPLYGPWPLKSKGWHDHFLNSTCDIELIDMRQGSPKYSDIREGYSLNVACNMGINKQQRHAIFGFLKVYKRHGAPWSRGPCVGVTAGCLDVGPGHSCEAGSIWPTSPVHNLPTIFIS